MNNMTLTSVEILMLSYAPKFHTGDNDFQQFWEFKYQVDPAAILRKLYISGYIEIASPAESLKRRTVDELKSFLSENNLKRTGNKNSLINRIIENIDSQRILEKFPQQYYCLTPSGMDVLQNNPNILFVHRHPEFELDISIVPPSGDINAYILNKIEFKEAECTYYNDWGSVSYCKQQRAMLAMLNDDIDSAIYHYLEICYLDISGLRNGVNPEMLYSIKEYMLNACDDPTRMLSLGIIEKLRTLIQKKNFSYDDVTLLCKEVIDKTHLPFHLYSNDEALQIILQRLYGTIR